MTIKVCPFRDRILGWGTCRFATTLNGKRGRSSTICVELTESKFMKKERTSECSLSNCYVVGGRRGSSQVVANAGSISVYITRINWRNQRDIWLYISYAQVFPFSLSYSPELEAQAAGKISRLMAWRVRWALGSAAHEWGDGSWQLVLGPPKSYVTALRYELSSLYS